MTRKEFTDQWNRDFSPLTNEVIPTYEEFQISERMLEDYLDIFRGYNSREGDDFMPYPHPFFDENGKSLLKERPSIKYILVGEARPPLKPFVLSNCAPINGDKNNTFFYDIRHVKTAQPWLSAPRLNWSCPSFTPCPNNKIDTLLCLASNGVILLDIFPYAISYTTTLRKRLNKCGVTKSFWNDPINPYNLQDRIRKIQNLLSSDWDLTMVAPCVLSEHIVNPINLFPTLMINPVGLHPTTFRMVLHDDTRCISSNCGHDWKKIAVSQQSPTARLIDLSF